MTTKKVKQAIKLWVSLEHAESLSKSEAISKRLTHVRFSMTLDEHAEYGKRVWEIIQERRRLK